MKLIVASVFSLTGIGEKSQKPFEMHKIGVLQPIQDIDSAKFQKHGQGFELIEMGISQGFAKEFSKHFTEKFNGSPLPYDLKTVLDRDAKNVVSGFEHVASITNMGKTA